MFVEFCYVSYNLHPIYMKLGMHEPLLILKVFVQKKKKIKPTKETRYTGCHSKAIRVPGAARKNTIFSKHTKSCS